MTSTLLGTDFAPVDYGAFSEKTIDNLASVSFCTELEANRGVSGGASHNLRSRNCRNRMQCFNLGASLCRG